MKIIDPSHKILDHIDRQEILNKIETIGRICYKSEGTEYSAAKFVRMLIDRGHEAMIEHVSISVLFVTDRGVSHELVRYRIASYAQESTRYCNYSSDRFDNEITVVRPPHVSGSWIVAMEAAEKAYMGMIATGFSAQDARSVLPHSLKTEIVVAANLREWRHILKLRTAPDAHPQMRQLMIPLLYDFQ